MAGLGLVGLDMASLGKAGSGVAVKRENEGVDMTTETAVTRREEPELNAFEIIEKVIVSGDLAAMTPADRVAFYWRTCESLGLNPLTRPFSFIRDREGKLTLYATRDATDQLRRINGVSVTELRREKDPELGTYTVYAHVRSPDGREDEASGVVNIKGMSGEALANQQMKAETKSKRRATLSIVGLGFLDESEVEGLGQPVAMSDQGELAQPEPQSLLEAVQAQAAALAPEIDSALVGGLKAQATPSTDPEPLPAAEDPTPAAPAAAESVEGGEPPPSLSTDELTLLIRNAGLTKMRVASELDVLPADVASRIEKMSGEERFWLAQSLGVVS